MTGLTGASPTFVDLFSGAGGLSLGLIQANWVPLLAIDLDPDAVRSYRGFFPDHPAMCADVRELKRERLFSLLPQAPDWVVGGPPCQGFSTVGKRHRGDPRNSLVSDFIAVVSVLKPANVLIENVLGLRDMQFIGKIREALGAIGYQVTPFVVRAADFGVPQLRRRVLFVGDRKGRSFFPPSPTHTEAEFVSVWDAIGDLPELLPGEEAVSYDKPAATAYQRLLREGSRSLQGHVASNHPARLVAAISHIPDGGNRQAVPPALQPNSGFHNSYSRLDSRKPAVAVTQNMGKPSATRCIHPFQDRGLTAREGARLQSFPDRFHFAGGLVSQRLQIANAVPPLLAQALGHALASEGSWR